MICWKLRTKILAATQSCEILQTFVWKGDGGGRTITLRRSVSCDVDRFSLTCPCQKLKNNRRLLFIFSVVSERLFSCSFNIKLETTGKTDVNCSENEISPVFVVHWHIGLLLLCFFSLRRNQNSYGSISPGALVSCSSFFKKMVRKSVH